MGLPGVTYLYYSEYISALFHFVMPNPTNCSLPRHPASLDPSEIFYLWWLGCSEESAGYQAGVYHQDQYMTLTSCFKNRCEMKMTFSHAVYAKR